MKFLPVGLCLITSILFFKCEQQPQNNLKAAGDSVLHLENQSVVLEIQQHGGAYTLFQLKANPLNPLSWQLTPEQMPENNQSGAVFRGHFLCTGRWGEPTAGEVAAGIPHNGEPSRDWWEVIHQEKDRIKMKARANLDGVNIERTVVLDPLESVFRVEEVITSTLTHGRLFNFVQHPTLAPPFLEPGTIVDANAGAGFLQIFSWPDPSRYEYRWPQGIRDSLQTPLDLTSSSEDFNYVTTHLLDDTTKYGWVTAATPEKNLLIGYIWPAEDYRWLNIWHQTENGKPQAKGLEFGTTGIGKPYHQLVETDTYFHKVPSFVFLDAGEHQTRRFLAFLVEIPADFKGVEELYLAHGHLHLQEKKPGLRSFKINTQITL
jgi:hypothetical protein